LIDQSTLVSGQAETATPSTRPYRRRRKGEPTLELQDYSGAFKPDLKLEDFSKEALVKMVSAVTRDYYAIGGIWHATAEREFGTAVAQRLSVDIWGKKNSPAPLDDMRRMVRLFNIEGHDVKALFKYLQVSPILGVYYFKIKCELINDNRGILTVLHCPPLEKMEAANSVEMAKWTCAEIDHTWIRHTAEYFNPKMKVRTTMELPRTSKDQPPCQYEFIIED
jgi:hypothetical protein